MKRQASPEVTRAMLEAVDNQLRDLNPPEAAETYNRLIAGGRSDQEARQLIAVALSAEMFEMMKHKKDYNPERYVGYLHKLPKLPWE